MKTFALLSLIFLASCAPKPEEKRTEVRFQFPASVNQSGLRHYRPQNQIGANSLVNLNDIDCYAVAVKYQAGTGYCASPDGNEILRADMAFGAYKAGSSVELVVPQGNNVTFHLIGFSYPGSPIAGENECPDIIRLKLADQLIAGQPKLLASTTVNVQGPQMEISMTRDLSGPDFNICQDKPFEWESITGGAIWDIANWDEATWGP